ncbi:MAG: hypothetical protein M3394_00480 [Actinomycetota bacterium]|nr:hypothetical protein [Actinomycetota bacterium]
MRSSIDGFLERDARFREENGLDPDVPLFCRHRFLGGEKSGDRVFVDAECVQFHLDATPGTPLPMSHGVRAPAVLTLDADDEPVSARAATEAGTSGDVDRLFPCAAARAARASEGMPIGEPGELRDRAEAYREATPGAGR